MRMSRKQMIRYADELHTALQDIAHAFLFDPYSPFNLKAVVSRAELYAQFYFKHHPESVPPEPPPKMRRDAFDFDKKSN